MMAAKALFAALWGARWVRYVLAAFIAIGALKVYGYNKKQEGKQELRVESQEAGEIAGKKSEKEHVKAEKPGAADRLLHSSCRDCE